MVEVRKMTIKSEIQTLIQTLTDQLKNFENVPEDRLEAFLEDVVLQNIDNYSDEQLETREYQIVALCLEADVRDADNIGHCGSTTDFFWKKNEWVNEWEVEDECQECGGTLAPDGTGCENEDCVNHPDHEDHD